MASRAVQAWELAWDSYIRALVAQDIAFQTRRGRGPAKMRVAKALKKLWKLDPEFMDRLWRKEDLL